MTSPTQKDYQSLLNNPALLAIFTEAKDDCLIRIRQTPLTSATEEQILDATRELQTLDKVFKRLQIKADWTPE